MELQFKKQAYQTLAVNAVVDCFEGQPNTSGTKYTIDPGRVNAGQQVDIDYEDLSAGFKNEEVHVNVLGNIQKVQQQQNLNISNSLIKHKSPCDINLNVEMETGTGKTYVYIKTMFELNKRYGWSKFIIVVPSIAIREGVFESFNLTQDHFLEDYGKKIRPFIYNSKGLDDITSYSSDGGINVMIINSQAFNAAPAETATQTTVNSTKNKIYRELDDFQSRRPIDVIKANKPILILDEPQKLEGTENNPSQTIKALKEFNPLFIVRYSATHRIKYNEVHRLDALDAYNQKLVKKINVRGITVKGMGGIDAHLHLRLIEISKSKSPVAKIEIEKQFDTGIKPKEITISFADNLYIKSNELEAYKEGFIVTEIDARTNTVTFSNGVVVEAGKPNGEVDDIVLRRIQIREAIRAHFEKERMLFSQGIKVLSLFFIDSVVKYRDYDAADKKGEYAKIFEEEYVEYFKTPELSFDKKYQDYLDNIDVAKTHNGYFSKDKKGKLIDSKETKTGENKGTSDDVDAYDLILKKKKRLLSFKEDTRFIFSHSALREGWDNPNVFVICTLKHTDNETLRRQEVGRGLRIAVNQNGDRQDNPATVHHTNVLTVVANESYESFVKAFQEETASALSSRPRIANAAYFENKQIQTESGPLSLDLDKAQGIEDYLLQNGYVDRKRNITDKYHEAKKEGELAKLPDDLIEYGEEIFKLIDSVFSESELPTIDNDRMSKTNTLNKENFHKEEFQTLWKNMNSKAVYQVEFDSDELISKAVNYIDKKLLVTEVQYVIGTGTLSSTVDAEQLEEGTGFVGGSTTIVPSNLSASSSVPYDLIGKIVEGVKLTRHTVASILSKIESVRFELFKQNPEEFISNIIKLINEQKATTVVEHLTYDMLNERYDSGIFTNSAERLNQANSGKKLNNHVFDYVVTDSDIERKFVDKLDNSSEVSVYSKLPRGFSIPTPVGNYNPDWAIAFTKKSVKHVYFVAETKGSMQTMELKGTEVTKIECAQRFFNEINRNLTTDKVKYDVVDNFENLMKIVGLKAAS
ncbi:DEAD/DEAH box helicase family protein [bacterium]|nr:DEAD/DEAH box helicase family protein [bacterium]